MKLLFALLLVTSVQAEWEVKNVNSTICHEVTAKCEPEEWLIKYNKEDGRIFKLSYFVNKEGEEIVRWIDIEKLIYLKYLKD